MLIDNPADLINVAIETLVKEKRELPAFSTLDLLVRRLRRLAPHRIFQTGNRGHLHRAVNLLKVYDRRGVISSLTT